MHLAIMNRIGPLLEKGLVDTTFACRKGKGAHAAARHAQNQLRRFRWFVKIGIRSYFDTIDHDILFGLLCRRIKGQFATDLLCRIIDSYQTRHGKGLPIGTLTSQHFANYYLDGLDRFLVNHPQVCAHGRYMDDSVWRCSSKDDAVQTLSAARTFLKNQWQLEIKGTGQINRSSHGLTFCGYRILPGVMRLTPRRKARYAAKRKTLERLFIQGRMIEATV